LAATFKVAVACFENRIGLLGSSVRIGPGEPVCVGSVLIFARAVMSTNDPGAFPDMPGWRFALTETSFGVYRAEGFHDDGRSVSRMGHDLPALILETAEEARNLPARRT